MRAGLVSRFWSRPSEREFEAFVCASADRLLHTAYLVIGDLGRAEDLVQDTLIVIARRWRRVSGMSQPYAYTRRVLINAACDDLRRTAGRREVLGDAPDLPAPDETAGVDLHSDLLLGLAQLSARQRATVVLRYWDDLSEADIAYALGCSVGTVKTHTSRALTHLRQFLETSSATQAEKEHIG
jgi:RNA polymerase sigma-70 factor (sigma-E family)